MTIKKQQFWPLNKKFVSFVQAVGGLVKGCMQPTGHVFDIPAIEYH